MTEIENFWDDCYSTNNKMCLATSQYAETLEYLALQDKIISGVRVLDFGVGLGAVTAGLFAAGAEVSALDISDKGLDLVREYCTRTYSLATIAALPSDYFDYILCRNVVLHIPYETLKLEFAHCLRSLKTTGIFAFDLLTIPGGIKNETEEKEYNGGLPIFFRTYSYIAKLIQCAGGECCVAANRPTTATRIVHAYKKDK